ncbi:MAG: hypothetical protein GDA52_10000 [Rhodobacteraceae bacterium]|nr:hypothetical protein [Paracoccaceae bacterium]
MGVLTDPERVTLAQITQQTDPSGLHVILANVWNKRSRTRQNIYKDGALRTAADLTFKSAPTEGFPMLIELGHPGRLFESVVLRHPNSFSSEGVMPARGRLQNANIDEASVTKQ